MRILMIGAALALPRLPLADRARETESRLPSVFNRLLQHYLPIADAPIRNSYSDPSTTSPGAPS
jgi:hypothetical protein